MSRQLSSKAVLRVMMAVSLLGIMDTAYLTADHYFGTGVQCLLLEGCEVVLTSPYSQIFSIPLAVFGLVFYSVVFVLINLAEIYGGKLLPALLAMAGIVGVMASAAFLYLQLFVIEALCLYCLISAASSTILCYLAIIIYRRNKYELDLQSN